MYSNSPLLQAVFAAGDRHPEKTALIAGKETISYSRLCCHIQQAASLIQSKGYRVGDVLKLSAVKEPHFVYMALGAMMVGVIVEMIDPQSDLEHVSYQPADIETMPP